MNHSISEMASRISTAIQAKHSQVQLPSTKIARAFANLLSQEGFLEGYEVRGNHIIYYFRYIGKQSCFTHFKVISTPGLRVYTRAKDIQKVLGGLGISVLSTSKGIVTDKQARNLEIGGEVLCTIW
jgi:small subunit ribosomal protein S8